MPINPGYEYINAERKFQESRTDGEKIAALEEMLSTAPSHKGAEKLREGIKTKLSKLKKKEASKSAKKAKRKSVYIKKEGAARVLIVGLPNSGKSYVLSKITNAKPVIANYDFTTKKPELGIFLYEGIKIQVVELPAMFEGFMQSAQGPMYMSFVRESDLIVMVVDGTKKPEEELKLLMVEMRKGKVKLDPDKFLVIVNKDFDYINSVYKTCSLEDAKEEIWKKLGLVYVYTKIPGKPKEFPPVALKIGETARDLAEEVHKDFLKNFKYARVWGKSVKHNGMNVGLDHKLASGDVVEFHMK